MNSTPKQIIQGIMDTLATLSGDNSKSTSPYFVYGFRNFGTVEGSPPQVRWQPTTFDFDYPHNRSITETNGLSNINQEYNVTIWAQTEEQLFLEFNLLLQAINKNRYIYTSFGAIQQPQIQDIVGERIETSDWTTHGEMLQFNYTIRANMPDVSFITSSIGIISSSVGIISQSLNPTSSSFDSLINTVITSSL